MDEFYEEEGSGDDILELLDDYESFADSSDLIATMHTAVERYGLTPDLYELIVGDGSFAAFTQRTYPAVENLKFDNYTEIQIAVVEGLGDFFKSIIEAISNFFKKVWEWISNFFSSSSETSVDRKAEKDIERITDFKKELGELLKKHNIDPMSNFENPVELYSKKDMDSSMEQVRNFSKRMEEGIKDLDTLTIPNLDSLKDIDVEALRKSLPKEHEKSKETIAASKPKQFKKESFSSFKEAGWTSHDDMMHTINENEKLFELLIRQSLSRRQLIQKMKRLSKIKDQLVALSKDPNLNEHTDKIKAINEYAHSLIRYLGGIIRIYISPTGKSFMINSPMIMFTIDQYTKHIKHLTHNPSGSSKKEN